MPSLKVDLIVDSVQSQKIAQVGDQAEQMGQKVTQAHIKSSHAIFAHMSGMEQLVFTYMRWTMIAATIAAPIYALERAMQAGLKTVDTFKLATIGIAATLTDSLKGSDAEIKSAYQNNLRYAEDMYKRVETAAAKYFASGKEMVEAWQILTNKGMLLTSQQDIDNLGVIVDRIKLSTQGQVSSLQIAQEMRAVLSGQAKATDQIALMLKDRLGPSWAQQLKAAVDQGTALQFLAQQFKGLASASEDVENTMEAMTSTIKTTITQISREAFAGPYKDVVGYLKQANEYLTAHQVEIKSGVTKVWEGLKWTIEDVTRAAQNYMALFKPGDWSTMGEKAPKGHKTLWDYYFEFFEQDVLPKNPEPPTNLKDSIDNFLKNLFSWENNKKTLEDWGSNIKQWLFDWSDSLERDLGQELPWSKLNLLQEDITAAELMFSTPGTKYSTGLSNAQTNKPPVQRPDYKIEGYEAAQAFTRLSEKIVESQEELERLNNEFMGLNWSGPGSELNKSLAAVDEWYHGVSRKLEKGLTDAQQLVDYWTEKIRVAKEKGDLIDPDAIARYEQAIEQLKQIPEINERIYATASKVADLKVEEAIRRDAEAQIANLQTLSNAMQYLYDTTGLENYLDAFRSINEQILDAEMEKYARLIEGEDNLNLIRLAKAQEFNEKYLSLVEARTNKELSAYMKLYKAYGYQQYYDKIIEAQNKILDITEQKNRDIGLSELDSYRLRMIQMQEFQQDMIDLAQQGANSQIDIAVSTAKSIEQYMGFNVPIQGTNISSMTGMPIGNVGQRFGNTAFPGMWFNSPQEVEEYGKNFNQISQFGGLVKVTGPAAGGGEQWFKTFQDANKFIEDWKNGLGQTTIAMSNLSSAVDSLTSKFQSAYQSFQSFVTSRERRSWTAQDWEKEFTRLTSLFQSTTDPGAQLNALNDMLDVLKELDKISEQQLQAQRQLSEDYLKSSQGIDDFINSLKYGPQAAYTSYGGMQTQYGTLKSQAGSPEGAQEFISFIQNTFLPYMKMFAGGGPGYGKIMEGVIADLETASDTLKGKSALLALSDLLGIDLNAKWEVTPDQIFLKKDWAPEDIKLWTDNPEDMSALFHKIENWNPTQLSLWGSLFDADFMSEAGVLTWNPTQLNLWAQLFSTDVFESIKTPTDLKLWTNLFTTDALTWTPKKLNLFTEIFTTDVFAWKPETLNLWTDLFTTDALTWTPEKISLWATDAEITLFTKDQWETLPVTTQDLISLNLAAIPVAIQNGDMEGAKTKINDLIGILGDAGLKGAAGGAEGKTGLLNTSLGNTETSFNDVANGVASMAINVKTQLKTVGDLFDALASQMGINFGTAGLVQAVQKINTQQVTQVQYTPFQEQAWTLIKSGTYSWGTNYSQFFNPYYTANQGFLTVESDYGYPPYPTPIKIPAKGAGGYTDGLTLAGELGTEVITPLYEPQRSKFLHDVGADPELIAQHILRKMAPIMQTGQNQGSGGGDIVLMVDGYELGRITAKQIDSGHYEIVRAIRGRA